MKGFKICMVFLGPRKVIITLKVLDMLAPKWFLLGINSVPWPTGDPYTHKYIQNPHCMNPVTLSGSHKTHASSCSSCVKNTLFYSMKTEPPIDNTVLWLTSASWQYWNLFSGCTHGSQHVSHGRKVIVYSPESTSAVKPLNFVHITFIIWE
jgi:hypothetical protein